MLKFLKTKLKKRSGLQLNTAPLPAPLPAYGVSRDVWPIIAKAEQLAKTDPAAALQELRKLSFDEFSGFLSAVPDTLPNLHKQLPRFPGKPSQMQWCGQSGVELLKQSIAFMRVVDNAARQLGRPLKSNSTVLDYGCGFGRLLRLFYYSVDPTNCYGVDPWSESHKVLKETGLGAQTRLIDYLPTSLPAEIPAVDLTISFSVFTHIDQNRAEAILRTIRAGTKPGGLLAFTYRPFDYWQTQINTKTKPMIAQMESEHLAGNYAYVAEQALGGDSLDYGKSSIPIPIVQQMAGNTGWTFKMRESNINDGAQHIAIFQKK